MNQHLAIFIILVFTVGNLFAQSCELNPILFEEYRKDVKHLTLLRMGQLNSPEAELADISEIWSDTIWNGLSAIFNSNLPERDIVFDDYCIHHSDGQTLRIFQTLYVKPDTNVSWYTNWENGIIQTNNVEIDSLLQKYEFQNDGMLGNSFKITTDNYFNLFPIADRLDMTDSIIFAEVKPYIGSHNQIVYTPTNDGQNFDFIVRWGDCPSGCFWWYRWSFFVDTNCNAYFMGNDWNNPDLPGQVNCNISSPTSSENINSKSDFKIKPNPSGDVIMLDLEFINNSFENVDYKLYNSLGVVVLDGKLNVNRELNINFLKNGTYFLQIINNNQIIKFIKN